MAINASMSINSSVKAADSGFCSQRDPSAAPSESYGGHKRSCQALSQGNQVSHRGTSCSTGSSLPKLALGSANPEEGERLQEGNQHREMAMNSLGANFLTGDN